MSNGAQNAERIAEQLGAVLVRTQVLQDFVRWLLEDDGRQVRAELMLRLMQQDPKNELGIRPMDLFLPDHLLIMEINGVAEERARDEEQSRPHVKACSLCNALVETDAARIVQRRGPDLSGLEGKVPEAVTDQDKRFGRQPGDRL